ncbi:MAG: flagellar assembly protein FliW [Desulfomonilia bacterium]|nr:flagellar assembly protein FliW [Deltaproteobacteria bacterium]MDX9760636.1 flagellar assembly protein FliW [Desulfomonilia bacterium]HPW68854.1 flagellar assembly protein FliW [Deltaproteobacteria bacterium]
MEITTVRFGTIPVQEDKVIVFPKGILGFPHDTRYILFPHGEGSPFYWLQSVDDGAVAFVVMNPQLVQDDYTVAAGEGVLKELQADGISDLEVMCIVTIPPASPEKMTINLLGPIVINVSRCLAVQIVSADEKYSHRHPILAGSS